MADQRSEKHEEARESVPKDLRDVFDELVEHYRFAATKHHGKPYISYVVLAELVELGWRYVERDSRSDK